jgi:hypothetical protein
MYRVLQSFIELLTVDHATMTNFTATLQSHTGPVQGQYRARTGMGLQCRYTIGVLITKVYRESQHFVISQFVIPLFCDSILGLFFFEKSSRDKVYERSYIFLGL